MEFKEYRDRYSTIAMERTDGILQLTFHTDGGPLQWSVPTQNEFGEAFADIARDPENKVVIMTGTGNDFSGPVADPKTFHHSTAMEWDRILRGGLRLINSLLEIDAPIISCINGPAMRHPEIPLLADVVLACPEAAFKDSAHFVNRMLPGDGVNFVFPLLLGLNRGRYFLLTGQELSAAEAKELGLVAEIHAREDLLGRAHELARAFANQNPLVLRYTRLLFTQELKRQTIDLLGYGLALEGLAVVAETQERPEPKSVVAPPPSGH